MPEQQDGFIASVSVTIICMFMVLTIILKIVGVPDGPALAFFAVGTGSVLATNVAFYLMTSAVGRMLRVYRGENDA